MTITTLTLSSEGQIVIPQAVRDELHWQAGTQLTLISSASGLTLKAQAPKSGRTLADLIGILPYDGPAISTERLCEPVDYSLSIQDHE